MEDSTKLFPASDTDSRIILRQRNDECAELIVRVLPDLCSLEQELSTGGDTVTGSITGLQTIERDVCTVENMLTRHVMQREHRLAKSNSYINEYVHAFANGLLKERPENLPRFVTVNLDVILGMVDDLTTLAMEVGTARLAMVMSRSMKSRLDENTMAFVNESCRERCHCDVVTIDAERPCVVSKCQSALLNAVQAYLKRQHRKLDEDPTSSGSELDGLAKVPDSGRRNRKRIFYSTLFFLVFLTSVFYETVLSLLSPALSFGWVSVNQLALISLCDNQDAGNWHGSFWYPVGLRHFDVPPF